MRKKTSPIKDILFLAISSFIVVAAWIGFNLYHTYVTSTITPELQTSITPITPEFDMVTINKLKFRNQVIPLNSLSNAIIQPTPTIAVPDFQTASASFSAAPSPIPNQLQTQPSGLNIPFVSGQ